MPHKKPFRPRADSDVTQTFNDGVLTVFSLVDTASSGLLPNMSRIEKARLPYQERKLGVKRFYDAKQNQILVERVVRVPVPNTDITSQDIVVTERGETYRIDLVQILTDVYPKSADLTLKVYEQISQLEQAEAEEVE